MILWFALLAAAVPATPVVANHPETWITNEDYPPDAMRQGWEGMVKFRLTIDAQGMPGNCEILISSGYDILDQTSCDLIRRRGHFEPARDAKGQPVASYFQRSVRWQIPRPVGDATHRLLIGGGKNNSDCFVDDTIRLLPQLCQSMIEHARKQGVKLPMSAWSAMPPPEAIAKP